MCFQLVIIIDYGPMFYMLRLPLAPLWYPRVAISEASTIRSLVMASIVFIGTFYYRDVLRETGLHRASHQELDKASEGGQDLPDFCCNS